MSGKISALDAEYIIDGVRKELTPRQILNEASGIRGTAKTETKFEPIVDESTDPTISGGAFDENHIRTYLDSVKDSYLAERDIPPFYADSCTRNAVASALLNTIWKNGHFRLDDLAVSILWKWDTGQIGNMAAFYQSVEAACSYLDLLGIKIAKYKFQDCKDCRTIKVNVILEDSDKVSDPEPDDEPIDIAESIDREIISTPEADDATPFCELPFKTANPVLRRSRKYPERVSGEPDNWLIYIPFDTCKFRLGGSLLSEKLGIYGGKSPDNIDSDYFIDCYEVLREFVEDGVIVSGCTVGIGGLMTALDRMMPNTSRSTSGNSVNDSGSDYSRNNDSTYNKSTADISESDESSEIDISDIMRSYDETDRVEVLFSEVPGAVIEIRDSDFDYLDAEMMLQDVAYYPIGHPGRHGFRLSDNQTNVSTILQSLIRQQDTTAEGED